MYISDTNFTSPTVYRKTYDRFKGVDFTTDPSKVADYRSPYAVNMIADAGGMPEKRLGWRVLKQFGDGTAKVNGIYSAVLNNSRYYLAHVGTNLYVWGGLLNLSIDNAQIVYSNMVDYKSTMFYAYSANGYINIGDISASSHEGIFILTSEMYLYFNGLTTIIGTPPNEIHKYSNVKVISALSNLILDKYAYVPVTSHARTPSGSITANKESSNLLTNKRINKFNGDNTSLTYYLDANNLVSVDKVVVGGSIISTSNYTVNLTNGTVTFSLVVRPTTGVDNVEITFETEDDITKPKMYDCTIASMLTVGALDNRIVLSGNPNFKNYEWISAYNEPLYFPDDSYNVIGTASTAIKGYLNVGSYQAILKEGEKQNPTIFIRSYTTDTENKTVFLVQQGRVGTGALSSKCMDNLNDDPLFLSESGVIGIAQSDITKQTSLQNRSYHIDSRLLKEADLQNAISCVFKGMMYIFINSHVYILDGIQEKVYRAESIGDYAYECFYWEDVPAITAYATDDTIIFGTSDGRVCQFNTDISDLTRYNDYTAAALSNPLAVNAVWSTKLDTDDYSGRYKTLLKAGTSVTIKPYTHSSTKIYAHTDAYPDLFLNEGYADLLEWGSLDFGRFAFNSNEMPFDIAINKKIQKYRYLQFIVKNAELSEGFGVYSISKYYTLGNYAK